MPRAVRLLAVVVSAAACAGPSPLAGAVDGAPHDARPGLPGPPDAAQNVRLIAHVESGEPIEGATARMIAQNQEHIVATTNRLGNFFFDVSVGQEVVIQVDSAGLRSMIRSFRAEAGIRMRSFALLGPDDVAALEALGMELDSRRGLVEIDFRHAPSAGYAVTMTREDGVEVRPGFGAAVDAQGALTASLVTLAAGGGTRLLLGNVDEGEVRLTASVPPGAPAGCVPCDVDPLPVRPGVVTWFDFECGAASDCR